MKIPIIDLNLPQPQSQDRDFWEWIKVKDYLHSADNQRTITEGQIWWAAIGANVGIEINGKSEKFSRPVLIFRKLSNLGFMGIPLTSQPHSGNWYQSFCFQGKAQYAALAQARVLSVCRLYGAKCYGELSRHDFQKICQGFERLYKHSFNKKYDPSR